MNMWQQTETLPSGHRLFAWDDDGRVYIADDSGATPHQTDDGTLWLSRTDPIILDADPWTPPALPLTDGLTVRYAPVDAATAVLVASRYGLVVKARERFFNVTEEQQ